MIIYHSPVSNIISNALLSTPGWLYFMSSYLVQWNHSQLRMVIVNVGWCCEFHILKNIHFFFLQVILNIDTKQEKYFKLKESRNICIALFLNDKNIFSYLLGTNGVVAKRRCVFRRFCGEGLKLTLSVKWVHFCNFGRFSSLKNPDFRKIKTIFGSAKKSSSSCRKILIAFVKTALLHLNPEV